MPKSGQKKLCRKLLDQVNDVTKDLGLKPPKSLASQDIFSTQFRFFQFDYSTVPRVPMLDRFKPNISAGPFFDQLHPSVHEMGRIHGFPIKKGAAHLLRHGTVD